VARLEFNEMKYMLCNRKNRSCRFCDNNKIENLFHILFECKMYQYVRQKFLSNYTFPSIVECIYQFFTDICDVKANRMIIRRSILKFRVIFVYWKMKDSVPKTLNSNDTDRTKDLVVMILSVTQSLLFTTRHHNY
jgi:hypothetical protein